jgi:hypothetical protein
MKRFSEEEQEELDKISESMSELDFDKSKREQEIITKLEEPEGSESSTEYSSKYKRSAKCVMSTLAVLNMFSSFSGSKREPYVCDYEPIRIKGEPGVYNPEKHLSRNQRKHLKKDELGIHDNSKHLSKSRGKRLKLKSLKKKS